MAPACATTFMLAISPMRTSERCNTLKPNSSKQALTKKVGTRWPSTWGQAADIPFSKSSGRQKTPLDDQSGERLCRGGQAILRFLWPIREKLKGALGWTAERNLGDIVSRAWI